MSTSLQNILLNSGTPLSVQNGASPTVPDFGSSTLHNTFSMDGIPALNGTPTPSQLDLNGGYPSANGAYLDNLPT